MYYKNTKEYTKQEVDLAHPTNPNASSFYAELGYEWVFPTPLPTITNLQRVVKAPSVLDTLGNRVESWLVQDMFADTTDPVTLVVTTKLQHETAYLLAEFKKTVPVSITRVQAMKAMKQTSIVLDVNGVLVSNLWMDFNALLASNIDAKDEWDLANELIRIHPFVLQLSPALGLTDLQLDELFILGGSL